MRALLLRLVGVLLALVVVAQVAGALAAAGRERAGREALLTLVANEGLATVIRELDPLPADARPRRLHEIDEPHGVVAWVGEAPPPWPHGPPRVSGALADGTPVVVQAMPLGGPPFGGGALVGQIALVVVVVGAVGLVLVRPIARDLDGLGADVTALGGADLAARVRVPADGPARPLAEAINALAARVEALVGGQRALLQAVSHELRTPPARIRFRLDALADEPDAAARARTVAEIEADLDALDALVGEVLTFVRVDGAPIAPAVIDTDAVFDEVIARVRVLRPAVAIAREGGGPATVAVPERLFARVVENLLTNAQRHAAARVAVTIAPGPVVHVDDDGPGVPAADRDRVLEPFVTGDPARATGGVGLGLAIARRIVERGGGRIAIGDGPLGGARVSAWFVDPR